MKIIKPKAPEYDPGWSMQAECPTCRAVLELVEGDLRVLPGTKDEPEWWLDCPECNHRIVVKISGPVPPATAERFKRRFESALQDRRRESDEWQADRERERSLEESRIAREEYARRNGEG